jgi:hypothetical protein
MPKEISCLPDIQATLHAVWQRIEDDLKTIRYQVKFRCEKDKALQAARITLLYKYLKDLSTLDCQITNIKHSENAYFRKLNTTSTEAGGYVEKMTSTNVAADKHQISILKAKLDINKAAFKKLANRILSSPKPRSSEVFQSSGKIRTFNEADLIAKFLSAKKEKKGSTASSTNKKATSTTPCKQASPLASVSLPSNTTLAPLTTPIVESKAQAVESKIQLAENTAQSIESKTQLVESTTQSVESKTQPPSQEIPEPLKSPEINLPPSIEEVLQDFMRRSNRPNASISSSFFYTPRELESLAPSIDIPAYNLFNF